MAPSSSSNPAAHTIPTIPDPEPQQLHQSAQTTQQQAPQQHTQQPVHQLTTDLAVAVHGVQLLALLVHECHCQLGMRGLRLLVRKWEEVPAKYGGARVRGERVNDCAVPVRYISAAVTGREGMYAWEEVRGCVCVGAPEGWGVQGCRGVLPSGRETEPPRLGRPEPHFLSTILIRLSP